MQNLKWLALSVPRTMKLKAVRLRKSAHLRPHQPLQQIKSWCDQTGKRSARHLLNNGHRVSTKEIDEELLPECRCFPANLAVSRRIPSSCSKPEHVKKNAYALLKCFPCLTYGPM
jgi:hypothetical protein